jgi:hypothetical protein
MVLTKNQGSVETLWLNGTLGAKSKSSFTKVGILTVKEQIYVCILAGCIFTPLWNLAHDRNFTIGRNWIVKSIWSHRENPN